MEQNVINNHTRLAIRILKNLGYWGLFKNGCFNRWKGYYTSLTDKELFGDEKTLNETSANFIWALCHVNKQWEHYDKYTADYVYNKVLKDMMSYDKAVMSSRSKCSRNELKLINRYYEVLKTK